MTTREGQRFQSRWDESVRSSGGEKADGCLILKLPRLYGQLGCEV